MDGQNYPILERIRAAYYQFTAAERKVADQVLARHEQVQFMSISQLAEECGTAEATISRFCRTMGLKGFNAFKIELARDFETAVVHHDPDTVEGRGKEVGRQAVAAVEQTIGLMDTAQLLRAVERIEAAPRVLCIGSGGSMILAEECAHLFSTVTGKVQALWDSHSQISAVATLGTDDLVILFSYSGATTNGLQVLELARQRGISTLLITRFRKSPAAKLADVVLCCGANESPVQIGSVPAKIAQLVVVDLLFQEYCHRNRAACEETVERIASALSVKHM